jgi:hypothetical protein
MKNITIIASLFFIFNSTSHADSSEPVRQAQLTVKIEKKTYRPDENGLPKYVTTSVCTKKDFINVYKNEDNEDWYLAPSDLGLVQCDSELAGKKVSVTVGGALNLLRNSDTGTTRVMKRAILFLSWGELDMETPQIVHSPSSDPWLLFQDVLAPIATGKIINGQPQPPKPTDFFTASITIEDGSR